MIVRAAVHTLSGRDVLEALKWPPKMNCDYGAKQLWGGDAELMYISSIQHAHRWMKCVLRDVASL